MRGMSQVRQTKQGPALTEGWKTARLELGKKEKIEK